MPPASWSYALVEVAEVVGSVSTSDVASTRLSWVIWGLLGLAVVIALATVVFWWFTRPEPGAGSRGVRWIGRRGGAGPDIDESGGAPRQRGGRVE